MFGCLCSGRELEKNGGGSMRGCSALLMSDGGSDLGEGCEDERSFGRKSGTEGKGISRRRSSFWRTDWEGDIGGSV